MAHEDVNKNSKRIGLDYVMNTLKQCFSNINVHMNLLKIFKVYILGWGLRFCIPNKLSGDDDDTDSRITFEEQGSKRSPHVDPP